MKTPVLSLVAALLVVATNHAISQGDLDPPPGPPAPTMKTLEQVEPRIPINAVNTPGDADSLYKIRQAGSYYLTGSLFGVAGKHGIVIASSHVTVDLMGFRLQGIPGPDGSLNGIHVGSSLENISASNGTIRD